MGVGVFGAFGAQEIELRGQRVRGAARIGPFRVGRWIPIDQIKQFAIKRPEAKSEGSPSLNKPRLFAVREGKKDAQLAFGVRPTLKDLAADLSRRCGLALPDKLMHDDEPPIEEEGVDADEPSGELADEAIIERSPGVPGPSAGVVLDTPPQPAKSKAVLTRNADGITIDFPPPGFRGQAKGLLAFGILWTGCVGVIFGFLVVMRATGGNNKPPLPMFAFLGVFILIGVGLLLGAFSIARRQAVFDVVNGALLVTTKGLRGVKTWQWDAGAVKDIRVGPSGTEVNNRPIMELQVIPSDDKKVGFLSWRDDDEIRWVAGELRAAAGVGRRAPRKPRKPSQPPDEPVDA
jgi:hypothetical protein